jgi:hypothetical protein
MTIASIMFTISNAFGKPKLQPSLGEAIEKQNIWMGIAVKHKGSSKRIRISLKNPLF